MKLTPRDQALLGVVVALLLGAGFYLLALRPERQRAAQLQRQIAAAQTALAGAQRDEAEGHAAEVSLRRTQPDWAALQQAVPRVSDIPALLKLLQRSADAAHVSMQSISLTGGSSSAGATSGAPATEHGATMIPVSLTFNGGYQALNRLVDKLDTLVTVSHGRLRSHGPLVGIGSVAVSPASTSSHTAELTISLTAAIYQRSAASTVLGTSGSAG